MRILTALALPALVLLTACDGDNIENKAAAEEAAALDNAAETLEGQANVPIDVLDRPGNATPAAKSGQ